MMDCQLLLSVLMIGNKMMKRFIVILCLLLGARSYAQKPVIIKLWPNEMPNQKGDRAVFKSVLDSGKNLIKITEVTDPLIEIYSSKAKTNKAAIIISPGGGQKILAWNLEGIEVADWLTNLGYTAVVLQYRVPNNQIGSV